MHYEYKGKLVWFGEAFEAERYNLWTKYKAKCEALRAALDQGVYYDVMDANAAKNRAGATFLNFCKPVLDPRNIQYNLLSHMDRKLFLAIHALDEEKVRVMPTPQQTPYPIAI